MPVEILSYSLISIFMFLLIVYIGITRIKPHILEKIRDKESKDAGISKKTKSRVFNISLDNYSLSQLREAWRVFNERYRLDYRKKVRARRELIKKAIQAKLNDERK